jgi:hypothetical protein
MAAARRRASEPCYFCANPVVPKLCSADPKGSATSSQGIHGHTHIYVLGALKVTYFLIFH